MSAQDSEETRRGTDSIQDFIDSTPDFEPTKPSKAAVAVPVVPPVTKPVTARSNAAAATTSAATSPAPAEDIAIDRDDRTGSSRSIQWLAILATAYTLYFAKAIVFPVVLAIVLAALMRPVVRWLSRRHVPEVAGAMLVIGGFIATVGAGTNLLVQPAQEWFKNPEEKLKRIELKLKSLREPIADIEDVADKVEAATSEDSASRPIEVVVQQPSLTSSVLSSTGQMVAGASITLVLLYFLLVNGTTFLRNVVSVTRTRRGKRDAVELVRDIEQGVSSYLLNVAVINVGLGIAVGVAMWFIGLPTPALWGVLAALLNFLPYIGAFVGSAIVFFVAILTFDSVGYSALAPLSYFVINTIEGNFITPSILGRKMNMNPIFVFLALAFWGWIWGIGGAILAVPLLAIVKISCEKFDHLRPLAVLLADDPRIETSPITQGQ